MARARRAAFYMVADMDSTLMGGPSSTAKGYRAPKLSSSPCLPPLTEWLTLGHRLLVVTSDDGHRPFQHLVGCIPEQLRHRVLLSTSDGAALFANDGPRGSPRKIQDYSLVDGSSATLPSSVLPAVLELAAEMQRNFMLDIAADKDGLRAASGLPERVLCGIDSFVEQCVVGGDPSLQLFATPKVLLAPEAVVPRGTMLWRNQPGPMESWRRGGDGKGFASLCTESIEGAEFCSVVCLNLPCCVSLPYLEAIRARLAALGVSASAAPNSVWLKNARVNKAVPISWLSSNGDSVGWDGYDPARSVGFGDNPLGNDAPLTTVESMPFVSVATCDISRLPEALRVLHYGGQERGTAEVLAALLQDPLVRAGGLPFDEHFDMRELVRAAVSRARISPRI